MNDACWNPFSTAWLDSNEYGQLLEAWRNPDSPAANTELEHRYAGVLLRHDQRNIRMDVIDAVVSNGAIFELPWNDSPVGLAAGIHMRLESEEYRPNQLGASAWFCANQFPVHRRGNQRSVYRVPVTTDQQPEVGRHGTAAGHALCGI